MQDKLEELLPNSSFQEVSDEEKRELARLPRTTEDFVEGDKGQAHNQIYLVNKLNYANFQEIPILVNFEHIKYDKSVNFPARPLPCSEDKLECHWLDEEHILQKIKAYRFNAIFVPDGHRFLLAEPELLDIGEEGVNFLLPDKCYEVSTRRTRRHICSGIQVVLTQNGTQFAGKLINFNAFSMHVRIQARSPQAFHWLNHELPVFLNIISEKQTVFAGDCKIIGHSNGRTLGDFFLEPMAKQIQRFNPREFRSNRLTVSPSPDVIFTHPLTRKISSFKVLDLSGSGFSVEEDEENPILIPGMLISDLEVSFAMGLTIHCKAQVIHQETIADEESGTRIKCGIAILDMDPQHHAMLISFLHQAEDNHSYVCNKVDLDALWDFFFETGFIYPEKYEFIEQNKAQIKATYAKIYTQHPRIARHFIYQKKGQILGHLAIVRLYSNAWLIHHHASRKSLFNRGGLFVLNQVGNFTYDSHRLDSLHMRYLMCYYRSENRFPSRVFGGAAKSINDLNGCSIDGFAYFHFQRLADTGLEKYRQWELGDVEPDDLSELELSYANESGGLMLDALDLILNAPTLESLYAEYKEIGLIRERRLYALKKNGILKAVFMINISDVGLNLSDLTNNIKVIILEPDELPQTLLFKVLSLISAKYRQTTLPVLIFPPSYSEKQNIPFEKKYNLWILNTQYSDQYFRFVKRLLRFA